MLMELCPCCGVRLLRHVSQSGSYLRCGSCRFEIPEDLQSVTDENTKSASSLLDIDNLTATETATAS